MRTGTYLSALCVLLPCLGASQQTSSATLETYFISYPGQEGVIQTHSWLEARSRLNDNFKVTFSAVNIGYVTSLDELCVSIDYQGVNARVGRIRTPFGFNNWSEYFYTGINHFPLIRTSPLVGALPLLRQDAGVGATVGGPKAQFQVAAFEPTTGISQVVPEKLNYGSARFQTSQAGIIVGLNFLDGFKANDHVYGLDARWTTNNLQVKGEYLAGQGPQQSAGYYVDLAYRLPHLTRSQIFGRTERLDDVNAGILLVNTLGLRQWFGNNVVVNLDYGWSNTNPNVSAFGNSLTGWTTRTMFQVNL